MKKTLLAIAVGAAMAPAIALAEGPTVYGTINLSLDNAGPTNTIDFGAGTFTGRADNGWELNSNTSHLGVRGGTDLDVANLRGFYQVEFLMTDPTSNLGQFLTGRNSFVGLEGDFGTVQAGTFNTPTRELSRMVDQFADMQYADLANVVPGEARLDDMLQYSSPQIAEMLTINVATQAIRNTDVDLDGDDSDTLFDVLSVSLVADLGDFYAGLGYDQNLGGGPTSGSQALATGQLGPVGLDSQGIVSGEVVRLVAGANMDALELGILYQMVEDVADNSDLQDTTMALSAGFHLNDQIKLKAQYANTDGDQVDTDMTMTTLGADYKLGRQTTAYAYASRVEITDLEDIGTSSDRLDQVWGLGVKHSF